MRLLLICLFSFSSLLTFTPQLKATSLVLWNTLGSESEYENSEYGPGFSIVRDEGDVLPVPGKYGDALSTTGGTRNLDPSGGYLSMNPDDFYPVDKTKGTIEFWVQKQTDEFTPYHSPLLTFFGASYHATGYMSILGVWHNDGLFFNIYSGIWHSVFDPDWEAVPVNTWVHLAFVWDGSGINGSDDVLRIYRNGNIVGNATGNFNVVEPYCCVGYSCTVGCSQGGYEVRILAYHEYARLNRPAAYMDNLIIWNYAKTDFSNRFNESPFVDIDIKPGSYPNSINLGSNGNVPVAIFSNETFDATTVDPYSVILAGAEVVLKGKAQTPMASAEDVNGDGLDDLVIHVDTDALELSEEDTIAILEGVTYDETSIIGKDTIRIVP